jgi:hypothetical protein
MDKERAKKIESFKDLAYLILDVNTSLEAAIVRHQQLMQKLYDKLNKRVMILEDDVKKIKEKLQME